MVIANNLIIKAMCEVENGFVTIIKQDNEVIQMNIIEWDNFEKEAVI